DLAMIESATFWQDAPEIETGEIVPGQCATEVFFLPAAAHTEKSGTFTQTQRMLQWRDQAVDPAGDQRSDLWFAYYLGRRLKQKLAGSADPRDRPLLDLAWDYRTDGDEPSAADVLRRISGVDLRRKPHWEQGPYDAEWGWTWPLNRRVLYNRASADPEGRPWSERKALVWWGAEQGRWTGHDVPAFQVDKPPDYRPPDGATGPDALAGDDPFIMQ